MKNVLAIDDAIAQLTELRKKHGNVRLVMPTGSTEDDWDKYTIYSYVTGMVFTNDSVVIQAGEQAYKR